MRVPRKIDEKTRGNVPGEGLSQGQGRKKGGLELNNPHVNWSQKLFFRRFFGVPSCKLKSKISIPRKKFQKNWKLIYTSNAIDWCKFQLFTSISGRAAIFWIWPSYTRISRENAACTNKVKRYCRGEARDQKNLKLTPVVRQHVGYPEIFFGVICLIHRAVSRVQTGRVLHIKWMAGRPNNFGGYCRNLTFRGFTIVHKGTL